MGSDFIFNKVAVREGKERETEESLLKEAEKFVIPELSENTKVKILNSLEKEHSKEFNDFCEFWGDGLNKEFDENGFPIEDDRKVLTEKEARGYMKDIMKEFFDCVGCRDVNYFTHKGDRIYITGGMSGGDSPTDSFDTFQKFLCLPFKMLIAGGIIIE